MERPVQNGRAHGVEPLVYDALDHGPPHAEILQLRGGGHPANRAVERRAQLAPGLLRELARLRAEGYRVYAVEQVEGAVMLGDFRAEPGVKYALVFGNEVMGVGQQAVDMCHGAIEIPQAGTKHSINVSVSGGVVLWDFFCQIRPKR